MYFWLGEFLATCDSASSCHSSRRNVEIKATLRCVFRCQQGKNLPGQGARAVQGGREPGLGIPAGMGSQSHSTSSRCPPWGFILKTGSWSFPGGPVVKISPSNAGGVGSILGLGVKIPHVSWPKNRTENRSSIVTNSIKT